MMRVFALAVALLSATRAAEAAGQCCFSGRNDCDSAHSFCSKDAKQCADCGGSYHDVHSETTTCDGTGMCCYSDDKDCDTGKHWCSSSADRCSDCGGNFMCVKAEEEEQADSKADEEKASSSDDSNKAQPVMLAAAPAAEPLALAATPGKCCYSGPKDCDSEKDWCSKDASHCGRCKGTFYNVTDLDLAEVAQPLMLAAEVPKEEEASVPGHCCYTGSMDCDGSRDWCSKDESHCTRCGGTFHANKMAAAPTNDTELAALPLQLAAVAPAQAQQADVTEDRQQRPQRQQRAQRRQPEQAEQPQELASSEQKGDWQRYIPTEYRHFFKSKEEDARASRKHTEARHTEASQAAKASAFLAVQESIASDSLTLPAFACLSVAGLAIATAAAVKASRRTVNLHTEVLG